MAKLTLRPWKYPKNKKMRLYWLCSPYRRPDGRWTVRAVFVSAEEDEQSLFPDEPATYEISEFPWGLLPNLRVGRFYVNGVLETDDIPKTEKLDIPDLQDGAFCNAFQIPKRLYSFFDNKMLGNERIWRFKVKDTIYYLPCLEMIRAFFAPSKTLTNQLLKPYGLESLIEDVEVKENNLHLVLSSDIPRSIVSDEMVAHLLWLTCDEVARISWQKVYRGIYEKAAVDMANPLPALAKGLPLETIPPLDNACEMKFTATRVANSCLIHEITEIIGLPGVPFTSVKYKHASFVSNVEKNKPDKDGKKLISLNRDRRYLHTDKRKRVKTMSDQPLAEIPKIVFRFASLPIITKQTVFDNPDSTQKEFITENKKTSSGGNLIADEKNEFSTDESYFGGDVKPIEFAGLTLIKDHEDKGLNDFIITLNCLSKLNPGLSMDIRIYNLPGNFPFCFINGYERRNFAIVTMSAATGETAYLIEISRLDNWQISTLLIKFDKRKTKPDEINRILLLIIKRMIENEGHWVLESLEQATKFRFKRIKHFNDESVESFASFINKQIKLYGIY